MRFQDKLVVVTGGNSGIGLASAQAFSREGAEVVLFGRNAATLQAAAASLSGPGHAVQGDVSDLEDLNRLFAKVAALEKGLDVLFVNAGTAEPAGADAVDEAFFDRQFGINVKGAFFTIQKALPYLHPGASIVLNSSVAAQSGLAGMSVYCATKAAVRSFARSLSAEFLERRIRVNVVSPGPIDTPIFQRLGLSEEEAQDVAKGVVSQVPMGRMGNPAEVAEAVLFLASPASSFVLGVELHVDGGMTQL